MITEIRGIAAADSLIFERLRSRWDLPDLNQKRSIETARNATIDTNLVKLIFAGNKRIEKLDSRVPLARREHPPYEIY
jgi:hypothetical protein